MPSRRSRIDDRLIAWWRLHNQLLMGNRVDGPAEVVGRFLAFQAENLAQAGWALATRCRDLTEVRFQRVLDDGEVLRLHTIRPTWHFVLPDDLVWLTELTGPRIRRSYRSAGMDIDMDESAIAGGAATIVEVIETAGPLTREEVAVLLERSGHRFDGRAVTAMLGWAEADAAVCSGVVKDGKPTFDLVARRAPGARRRDRDESLAELAWRYLRAHGPATARDLSYWAGLTVTEARSAVDSVADRLDCFDHDGRTYWHHADSAPPNRRYSGVDPVAHILQILDEIYRGYQDSRWTLDADRLLGRKREPSMGMALIDGQVVAAMTRSMTVDAVTFELAPYRPLDRREQQALGAVADEYGRYLGRMAAIAIG